MSLDDVVKEEDKAEHSPPTQKYAPVIDSRGSQDRRSRGVFSRPTGIVKPRRTASSDRRERERDYGTQDFIKVSLQSDPKTVAGKIAHCARSECPPTILAIGQGCINQAVKAVAIARKFCMQPPTQHDVAFDLSCQPAFREHTHVGFTRYGRSQQDEKPSLALYLAKRKPINFRPSQDRIVMPIAAGTEPAVMAGALAARIRENVEVALSAIGVDAVGNAMRAICYARLYLEKDGLDIKAMPEFVHINKAGNAMSGIQFSIISEHAM